MGQRAFHACRWAPGVHSSGFAPTLPLSPHLSAPFFSDRLPSLASSAPFLVSSLGLSGALRSGQVAAGPCDADFCWPRPHYQPRILPGNSAMCVTSSGPHGVHAGGQQEASNVGWDFSKTHTAADVTWR